MYSFRNDYSEGAHEKLLQALARASVEQNAGYGYDRHSLAAAEMICHAAARPDADIHFLSGGTQTNMTAISAFLRPYEAAIAAETGHINVRETGAIEATGHKVIAVPGKDGKLAPPQIQAVLNSHLNEHMVKPKLVYVSNSTELGTIYSKAEMEALSKYCRKRDLILYLDGARLGAALTAPENDLTLEDLGRLTDAFFIGGTKNGALFGEALVICKHALKQDFRYLVKQNGAMLAKGMAVGVQFEELFRDRLYYDLAAHANQMAELLKDAITAEGFGFLAPSATNQVFPILPNSLIKKLSRDYGFEPWFKVDENTSAIRLVTSWATPEKEVKNFIEDFKNCLKQVDGQGKKI